MKQVTLQIDDKALAEIRSAVFVRRLAGMTWGVTEAAWVKIIEAVEAGNPEVTLKLKENSDA